MTCCYSVNINDISFISSEQNEEIYIIERIVNAENKYNNGGYDGNV